MMADNSKEWRAIEARERALVMHLLRGQFQGKAEILEQLKSVEVQLIGPERSLRFRSSGPVADVKDSDAPSKRANDRVPVEGFYDDEVADRGTVFRVASLVRLALHVTDGRISELEFLKKTEAQLSMIRMKSNLREFIFISKAPRMKCGKLVKCLGE